MNSFNLFLNFEIKLKGKIINGEGPYEFDIKYTIEKYNLVKTLISEDKQVIGGLWFDTITQILKNGKINFKIF